ncbi:hypothetical protein BST97_03610 [Nonlabens spongiae]|uniref:Ig-like domain-containing protein n=1 Tax=Nonlabens spongiae TaxID=331648 RepID=A0A1W6MHR3_9FLAO|nr:hypothetical protein BST97_03610 [Nonlabens spongiae]
MFFLVSGWLSAQCPSIGNNNPQFCDLDQAQVSDLPATDNGAGVNWFRTPSSNTPIPSNEFLTDNQVLFLDSASGGCGNRQRVTVGIFGQPRGANFQGICVTDNMQPTLDDLAVNGIDVQWYNQNTGGASLPLNTPIFDGQIYYADQQNPVSNCRTSRLSVVVEVVFVNSPTGQPVQTFCTATGTPTIADLVASGENRWYRNASSAAPLDPSTPLEDGEDYFATTIDLPCESSNRFRVEVVLEPANDSGDDTIVDFCSSSLVGQPTLDLFTLLDGTPVSGGTWTGPIPISGNLINTSDLNTNGGPYIFTYSVTASAACPASSSTLTFNITTPLSAGIGDTINLCETSSPIDLFSILDGNPDVGGTWTPALNSGTDIFDPAVDAAGSYIYSFPSVPPCNQGSSATIVVNVQNESSAGVGGNADVCNSDGPVDLLTLLGGNPDTGGSWSPSLASGTSIFDPLVDPAGDYTYTVNAMPPCTQTDQSVLTITIDTIPDAGEDGDVQLCETDAPVDLFTFLGGTPDAGGVWTPALASGTGVLDPSVDVTGVYTYTVSSNGSCMTTDQSVVLVIVQDFPDTGNDNSIDICENGISVDLFPLLGPDAEVGGVWNPALSSGTGFYDPTIDPAGTYTYSITATGFCSDIVSSTVTVNLLDSPNAGLDSTIDFCSTDAPRDLFAEIAGNPDPGGVWVPALASGSGVFDPQVDTAGSYEYQVSENTFCGNSDTSLVTVTVQLPANAGVGGSADICESDGLIDLFTLLGGNPDAGGYWLPALASGSGIFDPSVDTAGTYTYNVNPVIPCTSVSTSTLIVTISAAPNAGTNASIDLCESSAIVDLFSVLGGTPESGGVWSPALSSGSGVFDPSIDQAGIYEYTVSNSGCSSSSSSFVTVNLQTEPDAGIDATITICPFDGPTNLFSVLGGTPDAGGFWTPALSNNDNIFRPGVDPSGTYTYTVNGITPCNASATATVIVDAQPLPDPGTNGSLNVCSDDGTVDLFSALGGFPESGGTWFPALSSGTGIFDPSIDSAGSYSYTVVSSAPCNIAASSIIDVTIVPSSNSGVSSSISICTNATALDLFTVLGGSPDAGGVWSPTLDSGTGIFDPTVDPEGVYTYTVTGTSQCPNPSSSTVTVSFENSPNAGNDSSISFCESDARLDLFNLLGNDADAGGTWSPALNSGTGLFNPAIDPSGVYTYTVNSGAPCNESDAAQVTVFVQNLPNAGQNRNLTLCVTDTPVDLFVILGGTPDAGGIWSPALASGSGVFDPAVDTAGAYTYTVAATAPCTASDSAVVTVTVEDAPDAGTDASLELCSNDNPIDLFTVLGGIPDAGGIWSPALASGSGVFDPAVDAAGIYTYTITSAACATSSSSQVTVGLTQQANAGQDVTLDICGNDAPIDLLTLLGGTPDAGGTWSPALASGSGVFDPAVDTAGAYTYTVAATAPCTTDDSAVVTVTVEDAPDAGADASLDLCSNDNPIDLFTVLAGTPDVGGTWSPALASGSGVFDPSVDAAGTYTYTVTSAACATSSTSEVTVNITSEANAGQDATLDICSNDAVIDLFTLLGGTPDAGGTWNPALASGSGVFDPAVDTAGAYTYTIAATAPCTTDDSAVVTVTVEDAPDAGADASLDLCSNDNPIDLFTVLGGTPDAGGTWSPALASGSGVFDPSVDAAGTYTYTVTSAACATSSTSEVTVNITSEANAGQDATLDICSNDAVIDLFTLLGGTPDAGGTWNPALASGSGVFDPAVDTAGIYTYTVAATAPCTSDDSAVVTVTVEDAPDAGADASLDLCSNNSPIDLFTVLAGTPNAGGTWSPALASGSGVFDPSVDAAGTYTYTVTSAACAISSTSEVTVNITPEADAGQDAALDICSNDAAIDLFTLLGGTPDAGGTWSPALASGSGVFDPAVDTTGAYTYTVAATAPCTSDDSAVVIVTLEDAPDAGADASLDICSNNSPIDLFTVLAGTPNAGGTWSPALASGSGVFDPSVDAAGTYTYTVTSAACAISSTSEVTVNITPEADAGQDAALDICSNDAAIDLFTLLGGTPDAGGTWSPALASGSGVFDPAVDTTGAYTYTVAATAPCTSDDSAVVTVTVEDAPDAGADASLDLCSNDNPIDLFTVLGGTPDAGGIWSPALASGSGVFDPAVDAAGVYTYTLNGNNCGSASSSSITIILDSAIELNNVVITPEPEVCLGNGNIVLIEGLGNLPDGFYDFEFQLSGINSVNLTFNLEVIAGTTQVDILPSSLTNAGLTNIELISTTGNTLPCGTILTNNPTEGFEVISTDPVTLEPNGNVFCEEDNPTIQELTNNLNTTLSVNWFDSAIGGNLFDPQDALTNGGIYYAEAISSSNCVTNERVEVRVLVEPCDELGIIIPDGFSPNGDGINETFEIKNLRELYPFFVLRIYNRNGDILFTGRAQDPDWDGSNARDVTIGSGTVPAGVYFFVLDLNANKDDIQGRFYLSD